MESKDITLARLVLGYLKNEKCRSAHKEFFRGSRHLQHFNLNSISKSKYVSTRFVGLTLEDIITEYSEISQIIQGRLEATNYYNEFHSKSSLVDQLMYLLNIIPPSRASSPRSTCPRSPGDSQLNESSPSCVDQTSDVETTSVHNLPGNKMSVESVYPRKISRSSKENSFNTIHSSEKEENSEIVVDSEVLAQTLLDNKEFHEKIAQTINKVAEKQSKETLELDETIKTVVKETEEDPIFDRILDEIIGSVGTVDNKITEESTSNQKPQEDFNNMKKTPHKPETSQNSTIESNPVGNKTSSETQTQKSDDVIVFDGSLDKYLVSNMYSVNTQTMPTQNPLYINATSNLLVLPSPVTTIPTPQQYYLINNKPAAMNCIVPPTILTEQDILSMPTVIVNDDRPATARNIKKPPKRPRTIPVIKPKGQIEVSTNVDIREYLRNYGPDESPKTGLKNVIYPKSSSNNDNTEPPVPSTSQIPELPQEKVSVTNISASQNVELVKEILTSEAKPNENIATNINNPVPSTSVQINENNDVCDVKAIPDDKKIEQSTPLPKDNVKKSTPKSGSHVRNLDFSTPPKITPQKKSSKEKQTGKKIVQQKKAVKSLFKQDDSSQPVKSTWDADLRSVVGPEIPSRETTKRKKRMSPQKSKKRAKLLKKDKPNLNTTDHDGALLEAALKTPVKPINDKEAKDKSNSEETAMDAKEQENNQDGPKSKTILSPSKLNANKRTFVNNTVPDSIEKNKFITPETVNDQHVCPPSKASRNITPMLETPLKVLPKTPGAQTPMEISVSPLSNITPFSKMLEANLKYVDIASIPTPSIPITPSFPPFTPTVDLISPYSNRPTDYSTSSSYYQPSDSEQNKYLENQLLEIEKAPVKVISEKNENQVQSVAMVTEHLNIFNKHVIGKKNLSLMKRSKDGSSSESSSNSESSNEEDSETDESFKWTEKETNDTVIFKKKVSDIPRRVYSLRTRSITNYKISGKGVSEERECPTKKTPVKSNSKQKKQQKVEIKKNPSSAHKKTQNKNKTNEVISPENDGSKIIGLNTSKEFNTSRDTTNEEISPEVLKEQQTAEIKEPESKEINKEQESMEINKEQEIMEVTKEQETTEVTKEQETMEVNKQQEITEVTKQESTEVNKEHTVDIQDNLQISTEKKQLEKTESNTVKRPKKLRASDNSLQNENVRQLTKKEMYIRGKLPGNQHAVLKELEEKRKRMIKSIKTDMEPPTKKVKNGKFKIKPIPDVSGRKRPRKSDSPKKNCQANKKITAKDIKMLKQDLNDSDDSDDVSLHLTLSDDDDESPAKCDKSVEKPDKSASDDEAQNLIEGLKERGIHLMQNKLNKIKEGDATNDNSQNINESGLPEESLALSKSEENSRKNKTDQNIQMNTSAEMLYALKDELDIVTLETETIHFVFNEDCKPSRTLESYNIQNASTVSYIGKLYIEEIDQDIDVPLRSTEFQSIFELKSSDETETEVTVSKDDENTRSSKTKQGKTAPSKTNDSKTVTVDKNSEEINLSKSAKDEHENKKCENILKNLNVDSFLNKMYDT